MTTDVADGGIGRRPVTDTSDAVADEVAELLARHGGVVVHGPWGAGKSTLLEAVCRRWSGGIRRVRSRPGDELLPCSGLVQLSEEFLPYAGGEVDAATRLRLRVLAARTLRGTPRPLVAVDDVQWLDPVSADVLGHAAGAVGRDRPAVVAAERTVGPPHRAAELLGGHPPVVPVPPAGHEEVADRLEALGLPARWSAAVLRHCGGNRALLAACCEGLARRPPARGGPLGHPPLDGLERADALADAWLRTVPEEVRRTLRTAALAHRPDTDLLYRAGHREAHDHVAHAVRAGLLTALDGPDGTGPAAVRFSARALARAAAGTGTAADRRRDHRALAVAVSDPVRAVWHRATATEGTDRPTAEDAARAAVAARASGDRDLASGLLLLAARLTPPHLPEVRSERLAEAALDAAAAGDVGGAHRAAACLVREHGAPEQRVKALLAVVDALGQDLTTTETLFAAARGAARDDPRLLAAVELRAAIRANVTSEDFDGALAHARAAAALARGADDDALHAAALTMAARMERVLGRPDEARAALRSALALAVPPHALGVTNSPEYLGARLAVFDGHLVRARTSLLALLPVAQAAGGAEDLTDLCRSLAEVDAGLGACADALAWAARARSYTREANLSPGPVWYTSALVHCHGGSFEEAEAYALRALRASRSEGDRLHTTRSLWIAGAVHLHRGRIGQALAAFEELASGGGSSRPDDPVVLRWQADAVEAFAAAGLLERAHGMLDRLDGATAAPASHAFARATVSRARALCLARAGDLDRAAGVFEEAAAAFAALGRPVEQGRTLLAWGRVERRRRRVATAKAVWERARSVCAGAGAHPWSALVDGHLARLAGAASGAAGPDGGEAYRLTERERLLVRLVAEGRTNPEAAHRLFVSRKTVEAMLSRVYRKVGVRNRTELAALVGPGEGV
ncbi:MULTISPECIES: LuxR C-terminal-related transcriptional regulator [unclassified Streptomyces]|uniref:helix-turn-helix transcriptional regulator n=3 Tax=Streptomyces TaxID=1883 RepID=UPI0033A7AB62